VYLDPLLIVLFFDYPFTIFQAHPGTDYLLILYQSIVYYAEGKICRFQTGVYLLCICSRSAVYNFSVMKKIVWNKVFDSSNNEFLHNRTSKKKADKITVLYKYFYFNDFRELMGRQ
jgi:hypothetical protein